MTASELYMPESVLTPVTLPLSIRISFTAVFSIILTLYFLSAVVSAFITSEDLSDAGKTLPPRSVLTGSLRTSENNSIVCQGASIYIGL